MLERQLRELENVKPEDLISCRYKKSRAIGAFGE